MSESNKDLLLPEVIIRVRDDLIGGAIDMAKEVAIAFGNLARLSTASTVEEFFKELDEACERVLAVTTSIAPIVNFLHDVMFAVEQAMSRGEKLDGLKSTVQERSASFLDYASSAVDKVSSVGAEMLRDGDTVFTYSTSSTALRTILKAHEQGKKVGVIVTESRPGLEGLKVVDQMESKGIPVVVGIDAAMGVLVKQATIVLIGADSISAHGSAVCKIGSYPLAAVARLAGVPFWLAADTSKFDTTSLYGYPPKIREEKPTDVLKAPETRKAVVKNPVFDITPPELITGIITEKGITGPGGAFYITSQLPQSKTVISKFAKYYSTFH